MHADGGKDDLEMPMTGRAATQTENSAPPKCPETQRSSHSRFSVPSPHQTHPVSWEKDAISKYLKSRQSLPCPPQTEPWCTLDLPGAPGKAVEHEARQLRLFNKSLVEA